MPTQANTLGAFVKYEAPQTYSREDVTVISGQNLATGTVVSRITASGKITAYNQAGVDGSQTAIGILANPCNATGGDAPGVIIARHAEIVSRDNLVWAVAATSPQRDTAIAALKALGIVTRATV